MRISVFGNDFFYFGKFCVAVDDKIFCMNSCTDSYIGENYTIFDYSTLFDCAAAPDDAVINRAFNQAAIRYNRILRAAVLGIVGRA